MSDHITPLLKTLLWFLISHRVKCQSPHAVALQGLILPSLSGLCPAPLPLLPRLHSPRLPYFFVEQARHIATPGPLHSPFPLLGLCFPEGAPRFLLSLLTHIYSNNHLLSEVFPGSGFSDTPLPSFLTPHRHLSPLKVLGSFPL